MTFVSAVNRDLLLKSKKPYIPKGEEGEFIAQIERSITDMWELKQQSQSLMGGRTLQQFWDDACNDYAVISEAPLFNDPVVPYTSSITRDKADTFIANIALTMMSPSVTAQNMNQEIDRTMGRVGRALMEWCYVNDGHPSENGQVKFFRAVHKLVVEGTVHVQDDFDRKGLKSSVIPNEELFVPNYWEPDIQRQSMVVRIKQRVLYDEAAQTFGKLDNFKKYVIPGEYYDWMTNAPQFKERTQGILEESEVQIAYVWIPDPETGRKKMNILINGIPMFPINTMSPYKHNAYPISVGRFWPFAKSEYYWGDNLPNRIREDKKWLQAWKTLLRYKSKLHALPPYLTIGGTIDEEIIIPAKFTAVPEGVKVEKVDGAAEPITSSDIEMLQMAEREIDRGSVAPRVSGQAGSKEETATDVSIQETNARKMLDMFSQQVGFMVMSRALPMLSNCWQFLPRREIKKIAVPDQPLPNGQLGTFEILFEKPPEEAKERLDLSHELLAKERQMAQNGSPIKIAMVDPEYGRNITWYVKASLLTDTMNKDQLEKQAYEKRMREIYLAHPELFNPKSAAKRFLELSGDDIEMTDDYAPQNMEQAAGVPQPVENVPVPVPQPR